MVAMSLTIYRNLFEILRSINIGESYVWLPFCLGPRMLHDGQNKVPRVYVEERLVTGVYDCYCTWLTMHLHGYCCMSFTAENAMGLYRNY